MGGSVLQHCRVSIESMQMSIVVAGPANTEQYFIHGATDS